MHKNIIILIIFIIGGAAVAFFLTSGSSAPTSKPEPEAIDEIKQETPELSQTEKERLDIFENNLTSGGPPKDGIPSIDNPQYVDTKEADEWLSPEDIVFGVNQGDFVAAFPQRILVWHEVVNLKEKDLSVTYCPLTGTTIGFQGKISSNTTSTFGVSGKLINSNLVMYDRKTDSYWAQILGEAVTDPARGNKLEEFPVVWTTWENWKSQFPETKVLSRDTGFARNYGKGGDPYGSYLDQNKGYYDSENLLFEPIHRDDRLHPKKVVVGIRDNNNAAAIVKDHLRKEGEITFSLGEQTIQVTYDEELDFYKAIRTSTGERINAFDAMWFSWYGFYPETKLIGA